MRRPGVIAGPFFYPEKSDNTLMKLLLISFLFSIPVFAQSELPMLLEEVSGINRGELCSEADFNACAKSLCGEPSKSAPAESESQIERYNEAKFGTIAEVEKKIRSLIEERRASNQTVFTKMKEDPGYAFQNWDGFQQDKKSFDTLFPDLDISYNSKKDTLTVKPKKSVTDPEYRKRLEAFAERAHTFLRAQPYDLQAKKIISQDEYNMMEEKKFNYSFKNGGLCPTSECRQDVLKKLAPSLNRLAGEFENANNDRAAIDNLTTECLSNYIKMSIDQDDIDKFREVLPGVKEDFIKKGMADFSEHSRAAFKAYLDNELDVSLDFDDRGSPLKLLHNSSQDTDVEKDLLRYLSRNDSAEYFEPFSGIRVCESFNDASLSDAFAVADWAKNNRNPDIDPIKKDTVYFSLQTCRHHHGAGKFVAAHELAHALSYIFHKEGLSKSSLEAYRKTRACAGEMSPDESEPQHKLHPGDAITTEEDMADIIAFKTTRGEKNLGTCILLTAKNGDYYQTFGEPLTLEIPKQKTHSPSFVRLIREAIYKTEALPKSCEQVAKEYRHNFKDNKLCI